MSTATIILIIIGAIIGVVVILGLVMSKQMTVEKSITVKKTKQQVFDYVKLIKNQDNFSVWNMKDPNMKKEYRGTDGQVGFVYTWDSTSDKNVGAGEQEIKAIKEGESIDFELRFKRPMENTSFGKMSTASISANETKVTWGFYGDMKFPMNIMKGMFQNMLGKDMEKSLGNLKTILDKN